MNGIFYCGRPITGADGIRMLDHLRVLETQCSSVDHLSSTKTDAAKLAIEQHSGLRINRSVNLFGSYVGKYNSWAEVYDCIDVSALAQYDALYLMGSSCFRSSGFSRTGVGRGSFPTTFGRKDLLFTSHATHYVNIIALLKAHHRYGIPLHEYAYDTDELAMNLFHDLVKPTNNYYLYYGYAVPEYNARRLDCTQYYLNMQNSIMQNDKTLDFIGGYTNYNDTRDKYSDEMSIVTSQCNTHKIFIKDKNLGIDTFLAPDAYNNMLESSRFTMVFPAYDRNVISIDRTIGALARDCLPLFHSECKLDAVESSFGIDLSPLQTTELPSESKRLALLAHMKERILTYQVGFA